MNIMLLRTITFGITAAITISSSANTIFYYQGDQISAITSQQQPTSFVLVNGQRIATVSTSASKSAQFYIGDKKNQAMLISGQQADTTPHSADYHAYGKALNALTQNAANNFTYNGEYQDPTTQLTYLRARDYDASQQRFVSMDSYHVWNRYNFTDANPIMNIDPSGHLSKLNGFFLLSGAVSIFGGKYLAKHDTASIALNIATSFAMLLALPASWEAGMLSVGADLAFMTSSAAGAASQIMADSGQTDPENAITAAEVSQYAGYAGMGLAGAGALKDPVIAFAKGTKKAVREMWIGPGRAIEEAIQESGEMAFDERDYGFGPGAIRGARAMPEYSAINDMWLDPQSGPLHTGSAYLPNRFLPNWFNKGERFAYSETHGVLGIQKGNAFRQVSLDGGVGNWFAQQNGRYQIHFDSGEFI